MKNLLVLAGLALALPAFAEAPADGLYVLFDGKSEQRVKGADGREFGIGSRLGPEVQEAKLRSIDNANTEYWLQLTFAFGELQGMSQMILVVNGTGYPQASSGSDAGKSESLGFPVSGRENAKAVAEHFKIKPVLRAHPGHQLAVTFVPSQKEFAAAGPKMVTLRIENVGAKPVFFQAGGRNRAERDNQFVFRATDGQKPLPDIGSDNHFGGLSVIRELKAGEVFEQEVDLAKWFAFEKPGIFTVHGSWLLSFFESREYTHVAWEDWATAEFVVRVGAKAK
jgi:hypothetical protein